MSIDDLMKETRAKGFDKIERHYACDVYREARRYARRHGYSNPDEHALLVSRQYVAAEIDKWQRRGYKKMEDR